MKTLLHYLSYAEGFSLIVLLFIAMPLKYGAGFPLAVQITGLIHGILFLVFCAVVLLVSGTERWPLKLLFFALISSSVPFGMLALDKKLKNFRSR